MHDAIGLDLQYVELEWQCWHRCGLLLARRIPLEGGATSSSAKDLQERILFFRGKVLNNVEDLVLAGSGLVAGPLGEQVRKFDIESVGDPHERR